jgi:anti-sigma factor RsiW
MWPINSRRHRVKAAITGKRTHFLEHLAHDPARLEEHDRAFRSSLAQLGERAVSKARDVPARPMPPTLPTLSPAAVRAIPNRPDQPLAVQRAFAQATGSPASGSRLAPTAVQPGPAQTADALPAIRLVPPAAAVVLDPGQVAGPPSRRSGLAQRLLRHLRLRR